MIRLEEEDQKISTFSSLSVFISTLDNVAEILHIKLSGVMSGTTKG